MNINRKYIYLFIIPKVSFKIISSLWLPQRSNHIINMTTFLREKRIVLFSIYDFKFIISKNYICHWNKNLSRAYRTLSFIDDKSNGELCAFYKVQERQNTSLLTKLRKCLVILVHMVLLKCIKPIINIYLF